MPRTDPAGTGPGSTNAARRTPRPGPGPGHFGSRFGRYRVLVLLVAAGFGSGWTSAGAEEPVRNPAETARAERPAESSTPTPGEALLSRVSEPFFRLSTFRAEFIQTQQWVGMDDPSFFKGTLYLDRPNRFRIEYTEPVGHLQVCDGERVFTYVPENEQVLVTRLPEPGGGDLLGRILAESEPDSVVERSDLDGQPVQILSLRPPDGLELERVRLWTRDGSGAILQYELTEVSGNRSVYRFLRTWDDPDIDPELFRFDAPPGIPVVEVG